MRSRHQPRFAVQIVARHTEDVTAGQPIPSGRVLPSDYDDDPGRYAANQLATRRFLGRQDIHPEVARRFANDGRHLVVDIGGGNGTLARLLSAEGIGFVVVDRAARVAQAPRPGVRADACQLPFHADTFDGAAVLWMLYHLPDPLAALREAYRVLCSDGLLAVTAPSRHNDPELASVLPGWGEACGTVQERPTRDVGPA